MQKPETILTVIHSDYIENVNNFIKNYQQSKYAQFIIGKDCELES